MSQYTEQEIDLMVYVRKIAHNWKKICLWAFIGLLVGFGIAKSIPREYTVVSKISPELSYRSTSLSSFAALAGVNTSMLNNTDALLPTVYPDIVQSTPFMVELFDMPVHFTAKKEQIDTTLYAYVSDHLKTPWWGAVVSAPFSLMSWLKGLVKPEPEEDEAAESAVDPFQLTKKQYRAAKYLCKAAEVKVDKKTYLLTLSVTMQDPVIAAELSKAILEQLKTFVTNYRTDKAKDDLYYLEKMYAEAEEDYYKSVQKYNYYADSHQGFVLQSAKAELQRLQNEVNTKNQLYSSLAQQLQNAQVKVQQETPVFAEILPPTVPLRKSKPSTIKLMFAFMLIASIAAASVILSKK